MLIPIDEVIYFDAVTHDPDTGAIVDADSAPTFEIFEEATDTAIQSGTLTKRTSKTGDYRGTNTASLANGYEAGKWYSVIVSGTVTGSVSLVAITAKKVAMHFRVAPAEVSAGVPLTQVNAVTAGAIVAASFAANALDAVWSTATRVLTAATNLTTALATPTNITAGTITTVTNLTNAPTAGDLTTAMKASVNAEVLDVLVTDTYAEPGQGAPAATTSLAAKINALYKFARNKVTQDATTLKIYADNGSTVDHKATVSDDSTTYTRGEIGTGP